MQRRALNPNLADKKPLPGLAALKRWQTMVATMSPPELSGNGNFNHN
jgi:hypothetical protein